MNAYPEIEDKLMTLEEAVQDSLRTDPKSLLEDLPSREAPWP